VCLEMRSPLLREEGFVFRSVGSIVAGTSQQSFLASSLVEIHDQDLCSLLNMYVF
jgi:hypothetical protein